MSLGDPTGWAALEPGGLALHYLWRDPPGYPDMVTSSSQQENQLRLMRYKYVSKTLHVEIEPVNNSSVSKACLSWNATEY